MTTSDNVPRTWAASEYAEPLRSSSPRSSSLSNTERILAALTPVRRWIVSSRAVAAVHRYARTSTWSLPSPPSSATVGRYATIVRSGRAVPSGSDPPIQHSGAFPTRPHAVSNTASSNPISGPGRRGLKNTGSGGLISVPKYSQHAPDSRPNQRRRAVLRLTSFLMCCRVCWVSRGALRFSSRSNRAGASPPGVSWRWLLQFRAGLGQCPVYREQTSGGGPRRRVANHHCPALAGSNHGLPGFDQAGLAIAGQPSAVELSASGTANRMPRIPELRPHPCRLDRNSRSYRSSWVSLRSSADQR